MPTPPGPWRGVNRPMNSVAQAIARIRARQAAPSVAPKPNAANPKASSKPKRTPGTPTPRAKARANRNANNPARVTELLTPRQINRETSAAVRLKYQPQEKIIAGQQRVSGQEQQNITDWFQQYKTAVAQ